MKPIIAIVLVASLTGCAPRITASSPRTVVLNTAFSSPAASLQVAEGECQKQGLHARLNMKDRADVAFDCVP
jgi:hypothetical protein